MSSIQVGALIYFTLIAIGAWIFFGVIFLQLKRFVNMNYHVPFVSKLLTALLVTLTVVGYIIVLFPSFTAQFHRNASEVTPKAEKYFYSY